MYRRFFAIVIAVLLVFALIVSFTGVVGTYFGKTAEMVLLGIVAAVLLVMFIQTKKDISDDKSGSGEKAEEPSADTEEDRPEE